jgi:hypothetical protein
MPSGRTILVLLILAAGLGGFFYYDTYSLEPRREKAESAKGRIWTVEPKDVLAVTVARKGETLRLKRAADGGWDMLEPVKTRGDRAVVDDMVTGLATARMDREIDPNPAKPADFGLDPPAAEVKLEVKGRAEPLVLRVGGKNPTGVWVYAREGAKPAVMTLSESIARDTSRPVADFRDHTVMAFDRKNVSGVDLDVNGDQIGLAADEPGKWRIVKPRALRADTDLVSEFLDKLEGAKAIEFVDDAPRSLAPYGLDKPARVTVWVGRDKDRAARTLLVGRPVPEKKGVYVKREGEAGVILTAEAVWTVFPKTVAALRDGGELRLRQARQGRDHPRPRDRRPREGRHHLEAHRAGSLPRRQRRGHPAPVEDPGSARARVPRGGGGGCPALPRQARGHGEALGERREGAQDAAAPVLARASRRPARGAGRGAGRGARRAG